MSQLDLSQGKIPRILAKFAWPLVLTNLLQTLFTLTDVLLAGRLIGPEAMSAVTIGGQSTLFLLTFSLGLTAGGQILIAQLKGAKQTEAQNRAAKSLFVLSLTVGIAAAALGFFLTPAALRLLQAPAEAVEGARQYMRITSIGLPFVFVYNAAAGILRGLGDAKRPLIFAAVSAVLHLGIGLLFVGPLSTGISGLAIATVTAQAVAAVSGAAYLCIRHRKSQSANSPPAAEWQAKPDGAVSRILKIGLPFGLQMCLLNLSNLFIIRLVNPYGVAASAALGVGSRVTNLLIIPMLAIGNAASTVAGQNLGAGKPERAAAAVRWALVYTLGFVTVTTTLTLLFPAQFVNIFTSDPNVTQIAIQYLTIFAWCYVAYALHASFNAAILGAGLTIYSLSAAGVEVLLGRIGLTWAFSFIWGLSGIFTAQAIAPYLAAVLSIIYYFTIRWRKTMLVDKNTP
ncbi:MAG: MATE family efflux transporter [Oscillospiraceae bacterium]|nr:MATE family efflux transporter [Oscillospiraceae bacterium]